MSSYWPYDPTPYDDFFRKYGAEYGIDPHRLRAQAFVESNFDPTAKSPVGARGLMQIMPSTAGDYGITDVNELWDPETSVRVSAQHRAAIRKRRPDWTEEQIDMAYNAGEGNMLKHDLNPPFEETQGYRDKIKGQLALRNDSLEKVYSVLDSGKMDSSVKKVHALLAAKDTPSTQPLGDYTQYPKGSKKYFQAVTEQGGLPAIRPTKYQRGEMLPEAKQPWQQKGHSVDSVYPAEWKARLVEVQDNDTMLVEEMGTGKRSYVRFPDVQAAEKKTELGAAQKEYMQALLKPGDQLTINQPPPGEDVGAYGRPLGRVYWHDKQGHTVDLSKPWEIQRKTESKPGEGDPGWWQGISRSALLEIPEFINFGFGIADWVNGDTDLDQDNKFHNWALEKEAKWRDTMERFMAHGYDTDGPSVNVPFMGEMRLGEMSRFLVSGSAYTLGVTYGVGKALKILGAASSAIKLGSKSSVLHNLDDIAKHSDFAKRLRAKLADDVDVGVKIDKRLNDELSETISFHTEMDRWSHELVEAKPNISAVERLRLYKDLFISHWSDKYHPMVAVARSRSKGEADIFQGWLNQLKASSDVAASPIHQNTRAWAKYEDGTWYSREVGPSLNDIWQGISAVEHREAGMYMAWQRLTRDLWPEWEAALKAAGGNEAKAVSKAKKEGTRLIPITREAVDAAEENMRWFDEIHKRRGDLEELHARMADTRTWAIQAILNPLREIGDITAKQYDQILAKNQHYAPFMRMMLDTIGEKNGRDSLMDVLKLEGDMTEAGAKVNSFIKGAGEVATSKVPLGRLHRAISPDNMSELIVDPFQAFYARGMAIQKYVNQQRVRNMLGEMIDETIGAGDTAYAKWIAKTTRVTTDPKEIEAILNSGMSNGFVRRVKGIGDDGLEKLSNKGYMTHDPALSAAIGAMNPAQMSTFKAMMSSSLVRAFAKPTQIFRAGTVLGLHFMIRNPFRDQFMAAALTKYGYIPVIDWWKGLFGVLSKHPVYKAMHGSGATQANFTAATLKETTAGINEITTGRPFSSHMRDIAGADGGVMEKARAFQNLGGVGGIRKAIANSQEHFMKRAQGADFEHSNFAKRGIKSAFHTLRRVSEIFEEATRTGAAMKAVKRAQKGKRYTVARSIDEAMGGLSGYAQMWKLPFSKGRRAAVKSRWAKARHVSESQRRSALLAKKSGKAELDLDMVDEIRNITLDFQRRGDFGETINAFYPFFNAELQDYARFTRALREAPLSTMMRGFAFVSVPAIANWYLNFDNPLYQQLADIEKELFIHPWGYDEKYKKFGRIPRPVGTVSGFFSLLPHKMLDYFAANDPAAIKSLEEVLWPGRSLREARDGWMEGAHKASEALPGWATKLAAGASMGNLPMYGVPDPSGMPRVEHGGDPYARGESPLDYAKRNMSNYLSTNTAARYLMPEDKTLGSIANTAAPQFLSPFTQLATNRDPFFRSPIEPWSLRNAKLLAADRYTEHTSPIEHALSKMIPWDVSPIEAGHLIRRTTGSLGSMLLAAADATGQATGMFPNRPGVTKDSTDLFLPKAFFSKEPFGSNSEPVREMYRVWDEQERVINSLQHTMKLGTASGMGRAKDIMRDYPEWIIAQVIKAGVEDLSSIHKARSEVKANENIDDDTRTDLLFAYDQYMTQQAHQIMMVYNKLLRDPSIIGNLLGD